MGSGTLGKGWTIGLGVSLLVLLLGLGALNAFNSRVLDPVSSPAVLVFLALSVIAFLLFVGILVLLVRNVLKLYADQRSRVLGTRLRTRMLTGAVLISLVPVCFMFAFSYLLLNRAVERWFAQPVTQMRDDSNRMALELSQYTAANARVEAEAIAAALPLAPGADTAHRGTVLRILQAHEVTLQGGFALVFRNGHAVAAFRLPRHADSTASVKPWLPDPPSMSGGHDPADEDALSGSTAFSSEATLPSPADDAILAQAQRSDQPIFSLDGRDYSLGLSSFSRRNSSPVNVVVGLPLPYGMSATMDNLRANADAYWRLFRSRREIRSLYMLLLLIITGLAMFASCWLALHLSKQVTKPVEALADAMDAIAAGHYAHRVSPGATEELGELVLSFNHMAGDLEEARSSVEASTAALSTANAALEARRHELETMLETIPVGVATLDATRHFLLVNRAFSEMADPGGQRRFHGQLLQDLLPAELLETMDRLLQRSHRMGSASTEVELAGSRPGEPLNLQVTVALLESAEREHQGYVLVMENATELLKAQRQSAWKEVARRVAHEIKNPLTPISLSSEQIARHIDRLETRLLEVGAESPSVQTIRRSAGVISSSVDSMRGLVDQFAALAQFPATHPRPSNLNGIVEASLTLFAGRTQGIRMIRRLAEDLPPVLADPEAMKRALSNLVDNAVEAMQGRPLRELSISTALLPSGGLELVLADTGTGLTDEMRERLFLPYFSTKQRGTGLGLAIAAKIVQEQGGTIRAEQSEPVGARFIVELLAVSVGEPEAQDGKAEMGRPVLA